MKLFPDSRRSSLWRFALAALIVVLFTATATAVAGLLQFKQFATDLSLTGALPAGQVTVANPGNPQTLLLIGSDHRAGTPWSTANTDTMMLVRLDPNSDTINVLSLPRDLKVKVPGHGTRKLNAAYSLGGPNLLLETIRDNVFPYLNINHIIDVNFGGFSKLVNAIGCVYTDVDRRYFNNTAITDYSSIDIQPGYQKLCGTDALEFVRFRHADNDIVRNARQQDFLRWAKDQYSESQLIAARDRLLRIFGANTESDEDLHTVDGLINLFNLVAFSAGHQIKQVRFPAVILPCTPLTTAAGATVFQTPCYVTATAAAEAAAYQQFMTPTVPQPPPASAPKPAPTKPNAGHPSGGSGVPPGLTADLADGQAQAAAYHQVGMPLYAPSLVLSGSQYCTADNFHCTVQNGESAASAGVPSGYPRAYTISDLAGQPHFAYRMTLVANPVLGQYYGVQGTTWQNPPILAHPTQTRSVGGKQLLLYYNASQLSMVAWHTPQGVYWISNTLTDSIRADQLIAIAASLARVR